MESRRQFAVVTILLVGIAINALAGVGIRDDSQLDDGKSREGHLGDANSCSVFDWSLKLSYLQELSRARFDPTWRARS